MAQSKPECVISACEDMEREQPGNEPETTQGRKSQIESAEETEPKRSHFVNAKEWYDYHEAMRILEQIGSKYHDKINYLPRH